MRRLARRKKWSHRPKQKERDGNVGKLPDFSTFSVNQLARALNENTESLFPEEVSFRYTSRGLRPTASEATDCVTVTQPLRLANYFH